MKKTNIIFLLFTACLLVGCQQTPDEVVERMERYGQGEQLQKSEKEYCSIEELRKVNMADIKQVSNNIKLPEQVDFSQIESIGTLVLKRYEGYGANKNEIATLFNVKNPNWKKVEDLSVWYETENEQEHYYLSVDDNGDVSYIGDVMYDNLADEVFPEEISHIHLTREECPQISCCMDGDDVPLAEVLEKGKMWVDQLEILQDEFEYKLLVAQVRELSEEKHRVVMLFQRMYKGIGLNNIAFGSCGRYMESNPYDTSDFMVAWDGMEDVSYLLDAGKVLVEKEEPIDEVISLQSAVRLVEEELAGFSEIEICEIRVEYVMRAKWMENEKNNTEQSGAIFHAKPVYTFLIEFGESDENDFGFMECNEYAFVNVDMRDGTIETNFEEIRFHN